jgi:hypothetical protein
MVTVFTVSVLALVVSDVSVDFLVSFPPQAARRKMMARYFFMLVVIK